MDHDLGFLSHRPDRLKYLFEFLHTLAVPCGFTRYLSPPLAVMKHTFAIHLISKRV